MKLEKIHQDKRGEIYILKGNLKEHKEITFLRTNKGFARGGCIHRLNDEFITILEGKIHYFLGDDNFVMKKGDSMKVPRGTTHYFVSLTDSLAAEWGCLPEEKIEKHASFRRIVEEINSKNKK